MRPEFDPWDLYKGGGREVNPASCHLHVWVAFRSHAHNNKKKETEKTQNIKKKIKNCNRELKYIKADVTELKSNY